MSSSPLPAHAVRETPAAPPPGPAFTSSPKPEPNLAQPRSAQWTAGALVAGLLVWISVQGIFRWIDSFAVASLPRLQLNLNEASRAQLLQLPGVGPALAERIAAYRQTHGPFQSMNDLRRVPGIGPAIMERLRPHVFVPLDSAGAATARLAYYPSTEPAPASKSKKERNWTGPPLDLNWATAAELQKLPGIGPKLSERIIAFRATKPFAVVEDLRKVSGIGAKTLEKLRPYVAVSGETETFVSVK